MKTIALAALITLSSSAAFAQTAAVNNNATIGVQSNTQVGDFNKASNNAFINQNGAANASGFPHSLSKLPSSQAQVNNAATIGAQVNFQNGAHNAATNNAQINQNGFANAFGQGTALVGQAGTIGAQTNDQFGYGNFAANGAAINQTGTATSTGPVYKILPYPLPKKPSKKW